jgi:hypothetical protein
MPTFPADVILSKMASRLKRFAEDVSEIPRYRKSLIVAKHTENYQWLATINDNETYRKSHDPFSNHSLFKNSNHKGWRMVKDGGHSFHQGRITPFAFCPSMEFWVWRPLLVEDLSCMRQGRPGISQMRMGWRKRSGYKGWLKWQFLAEFLVVRIEVKLTHPISLSLIHVGIERNS